MAEQQLSPMMRQYRELKKAYSDCLLFFRLGDFYEMFFEDAITASRELTLFLTSRDCGLEQRAPMCGVPHHSVDTYITRLVERGYKIAICEQLQDPALCKGLVERGVVRVITPGTVIEDTILDEQSNNYLFCAALVGERCGYSYCDVSTGGYFAGECATITGLSDVINRTQPKEMLINQALDLRMSELSPMIRHCSPLVSGYDEWAFEPEYAEQVLKKHFNVTNLLSLGLKERQLSVMAAGALMDYLNITQKNSLLQIRRIILDSTGAKMTLDAQTRRNLELVRSLRDGSTKGTLFSLLNKTKTAMGARMLKSWILEPLCSLEEINGRLDAVNELVSNAGLLENIRSVLTGFLDVERLITKLSYNTFDAKNCVSLKNSVVKLPALKTALEGSKSALLKKLYASLDTLEDITSLVDDAIADEPASGLLDGGIIKTGFNAEVDKYRSAAANGQQWILDMEERERAETGIKNLKVGYNRVFGYYIEVTKSFLSLVPYRYIRKQTLANAERYVTPELKELEETLLRSEELQKKLEYEVFVGIRERIVAAIGRMQSSAQVVAETDALCSYATASVEYRYVRPVIQDDGIIDIKNGRHPVVERMASSDFIANDTRLDRANDLVMIITGPNMAGKSTYMRQVGLLALMAHIGCFVPADSAKICLVDRIFTRVGASDDLAAGQSTFMVEMSEVSGILKNATSRSLLILDEIGRGTSTYDGLSIAWAVIEYLCGVGKIGAKTMFATHYHELTELENTLPGVKNYSITVREYGSDIVFLHKIVRGSSGQSYGIEVAKLAGLPAEIISRAKELLGLLLSKDRATGERKLDAAEVRQLEFLTGEKNAADDIIATLRETNTDNITPLQALGLLCELKAKAGR